MSYERLGERLRMAREQAQMTQTEAAHALGVVPATLNQYESGKRRVEALSLEQLSTLYGVPLLYFFGQDAPQAVWEQALRLKGNEVAADGKAGINRVIQKIHQLEELFKVVGTPFPGRPHQPFPPQRETSLSNEDVAELAERARRHYDLGLAPLPNVRGFLETQGYHVFAVPMGHGDGQLSGFSFEHPDLGPLVIINEDQAWSHGPFTIAHEMAHRLFHYDRPLILSRMTDDRPVEIFADRFAAYFLIPREALHERLRAQGVKVVARPEEVVHLARYFGVSYGAMLRTLREERRLVANQQTFAGVKPISLARALGYQALTCEFGLRPLPAEERLPRVFLELAYRAAREEKISLRRVAELLDISDLELEDRLGPDVSEEAEEANA